MLAEYAPEATSQLILLAAKTQNQELISAIDESLDNTDNTNDILHAIIKGTGHAK